MARDLVVRSKPSPASILRAIERSQGALDMSELAARMVEQFGGMGAISKEYHDSFLQTGAGSTARQKMLEGMIRVFGAAAPKTTEEDLSLLTDEDLERTIQLVLAKAGMSGESDAVQAQESAVGAGEVPPAGGSDLGGAAAGDRPLGPPAAGVELGDPAAGPTAAGTPPGNVPT